MSQAENKTRAADATVEHLAARLACIAQAGLMVSERDFAGLLALLSPRIVSLIRQYCLEDMRDDAEQVAAIGVHRALKTFDPERAAFTTHATWQIRGELQSLRHHMRLDQRRSARTAGIRTVSLEDLRARVEDRLEGSVFEIVDDAAVDRIERGASDSMTRQLAERLMTKLESPKHEREIFLAHVFDSDSLVSGAMRKTPEQRRQIVRRTVRNCATVLAA